MKKIILFVLAVIILSCSAVPALAQSGADSGGGKDTSVSSQAIPCSKLLPCITPETQKTGQGVRTYLTETFGAPFFKSFLGIVAVSAVIFIIIGGMQMHIAVGQEEKLTAAKKTITWAIVGLVLSILSLAMIQIVANIF